MREYALIVPVYNRPDEVDDLLASVAAQPIGPAEILIVEDGSSIPCKEVVERYAHRLPVRYFYIDNRGPGGARNYGASQSRSEYLIILDSDCVLPPGYLENVDRSVSQYRADAFGGADRAHPGFSTIQKAINYAMTSFFTTGGIRGSRKKLDKFYPRSFNMGVKREVYAALSGFSNMRYGEDIDFSIRIFEGGYTCCYFPDAWVYHKRRTSFRQFFRQVQHSGEARIALYRKYPGSLKLVHCLPAVFTIGLCALLLVSLFFPAALYLLAFYVLILFIDSLWKNKNLKVALYSVVASFFQLTGYGSGFIKAVWRDLIRKKKE